MHNVGTAREAALEGVRAPTQVYKPAKQKHIMPASIITNGAIDTIAEHFAQASSVIDTLTVAGAVRAKFQGLPQVTLMSALCGAQVLLDQAFASVSRA